MDENHSSSMLEIPFFRKGTWIHPVYGTLVGDDELFDEFIKNFHSGVLGSQPYVRLGHDIVPVDYTKTGDAPAVAWVTNLVVRGDVIYALASPTSPEVTDAVRERKFRYSSAEFQRTFKDKETGQDVGAVLQAIALTNEPFLTKLPEVVALSDDKTDTILMDFKEVDDMDEKDKNENPQDKAAEQEEVSLLKRILQALLTLGKKEEECKVEESEPAVEKNVVPEEVKLSDYQALQRKIQDLETRQHSTEESRRRAEVDLWGQQMVQQGIPPALVDAARPILLSDPQNGVIKLSDGAEKSLHDQVKELIAALPQANRLQLSQFGGQFTPAQPGSPEDIAVRVNQDILDVGGSIGEDGKYRI